MLISPDTFNQLKSRDLIPIKCQQCNSVFYRTKHTIQDALAGRCGNKYDHCSRTCYGKSRTTLQTTQCAQCGKLFQKPAKQIKERNFCTQSCAATYNNQHKTYGCRRSKLELFLEQQIEKYYPELKCQYNNHSAIESELDFYFPTLRLAIELNGIFHYEPIYGTDKLDRIQNNDAQKSIQCEKFGIELCTIDTSACKHLTQSQKDKYWIIVNSLIQLNYKRHGESTRIRT